MARIFYGFVLVGVVLTVLVAGVYPLPQHQRYRSNISVIPDGGREESFTIHWPQDRIQPVTAGRSGPLMLAGGAVALRRDDGAVASVEAFRLRDSSGNVIGIASRSTTTQPAPGGGVSQGSDWMLLLPSRGSLFLTQVNSRDVAPRPRGPTGAFAPAMDATDFWAGATRARISGGPAAGGSGTVAGGTGEFSGLGGSFDETWELEQVAADGTTRGTITLVTRVAAQ